MKALAWITLWAVFASPVVIAREVSELDIIRRETRIVEDVMRAALRDRLRGDVRVTDVNAEYLARQGVLVSVSLSTPWLRIDEKGHTSIEFHGNISIPEIPAMVENILHDLQINVPPYEPEALEELNDLRKEQRELRLEGREIRAKLRDKRRELIRETERDEKREIETHIGELEAQLDAVDKQYDNLAKEIEAQYETLRSVRVHASAPTPPQPGAAPAPPTAQSVDTVIAEAVCDYGATLKTLSSENYLTVVLRRGDSSQYYAFKMDHVYQCSSRSMRAERLLELAYRYEG